MVYKIDSIWLYFGALCCVFAVSAAEQFDYFHSPLQIQEINFLHTTDTHTWLRNKFGVDWGHYSTFIQNLRASISEEQDLIVIDTGDKIDGNGLGDATSPKGLVSYDIFNMNMAELDLLTLGNHELYTTSSSSIEYYTTAKNNEKYVSSNVEFFDSSLNKWVSFGNKYRYFETGSGKRVLALSFLFDFKRFNELARVTSLEEELQKDWFKTDILHQFNDDNIDLLIVFGHLPIQHGENQELLFLHDSLRKHFKTSIIQYFGGHSHIRDFVSIDEKSTALQSGRFCETVGFLSLKLSEKPNFFRKYLDFSRQSFDYHLDYLNATAIDWNNKNEISKKVDDFFQILNLDKVKGYIPNDYYMNNKPLSSKFNLYNLIVNKVLPKLEKPIGREHVKRLITINTGLIRFDLLKGNFTENTKFQVSPYENKWKVITLPYHFAKQIRTYLNSETSILALKGLSAVSERHVNNEQYNQAYFNTISLDSDDKTASEKFSLPLGPVTCDDFGCDGEDTLHKPLVYFRLPNVVQYSDDVFAETEDVDFIYLDFFESDVFRALEIMNYNGPLASFPYTARSILPILEELFNVVEAE